MRHGALALVVTLGLAGCAVPPHLPETPPVPPDPALLHSWTATGRMAFAATGEGGSGTFVWHQVEARTRLDLRGPFGAGALRILADEESLAVDDGTGRSVDAEAARVELQARLGVDLPWTSLRYWMLGVPAPGAPAAVSTTGAAPATVSGNEAASAAVSSSDAASAAASSTEAVPRRVIEQADWTIGYDAFTTEAGVSLPKRFTARRGEVHVKVVVDDWTVSSGARSAPDLTR